MKHQLYGDGIHDDTAAIQEMLDSGIVRISLPEPEKNYLISKTLKIHSCQELVLSRWTIVKLAPGSNCPMLANDDFEKGSSRIVIRGGIWDFDNIHQAPNPMMVVDQPRDSHRMSVPEDYPVDPVDGMRHGLRRNDPYHHDRYFGMIFQFINIDGFEMSDLVLKNPVTYAAKFARLSNFTIKHITFDFNEGNPSPDNMDGLHFDGFCHDGFIQDIKGNCYDDFLAFNAEDSIADSPGFGPIWNIAVDGIYADRCHSAVRFLSCGSKVSNITVRNVFGNFYRYAFGFTHFVTENPARGIFDNIVLENLFIGKALALDSDWNRCPDWGLILGEGSVGIGSLRITGFHRVEEKTPTPSIELENDCEIECLTLEDCSIENHTSSPVTFLQNSGKIGILRMEDCRVVPVSGGGSVTNLVNSGQIGRIMER